MTYRVHAIARSPSLRMDACELTHLPRTPIDPSRAIEQHARYCEALMQAGASLQVLPSDDTLPDCAFLEDTAIILPELAILCRPGVNSRLDELPAIESLLAASRPIARIQSPATIEGGDALVIGRQVFIGHSNPNQHRGHPCTRKSRGATRLPGNTGCCRRCSPFEDRLHRARPRHPPHQSPLD